jgi:hypothetical protein
MSGYWIFFIYVCLMAFIIAIIWNKEGTKGDPNLMKVEQGLASKIEFQGHSYVVWSINLGGGIVHDPDCKCKKGE